MHCMLLAQQYHYDYWEANSKQAIAEHLINAESRKKLIQDNYPAMKFINPDNQPDSLLAISLANEALKIFSHYGDVYQVGGAYRTLAFCYKSLGDYNDALKCLQKALKANPLVAKAPELIASIREQMSVVFSAMNIKQQSDYNRNIYLDLQDMTRQDRYFESRADRLDKESSILNIMIGAVILMIVILLVLLFIFNKLRHKKKERDYIEKLLKPLQEWNNSNNLRINYLNDKIEDINNAYEQHLVHIVDDKKKNIERRAKISLVNSIIPFIDRIINEVSRLKNGNDNDECKKESYNYRLELTDKINDYNEVLTQWIQLRQGDVSLHIESFALQSLFDILSKSRMSFQLKGVDLIIDHTDAIVKADRVLTLFMINTIADNARKFTPKGGNVRISSSENNDYVEISVSDTGCGLSEESMANIFNHKIYNGHGFGLMNCKGIIEKYRKMSQIFSVCTISAESAPEKGSRFFFRLPKGIRRTLALLAMLVLGLNNTNADILLERANSYADSTYYANINSHFSKALDFADSARYYLNEFYLQTNPYKKHLMLRKGNISLLPAEISWLHDRIPTDYNIILDIRNESAVAALALHKWDLYAYNNKVYTQLFKELSADNSLPAYCHDMQQSQSNKTIAVILLVLLLLMILPAYYFLYYRHRLYYHFCVEQVKRINNILLKDDEPEKKLQQIRPLAKETYPAPLQNIVSQIQQALQDSIDLQIKRNTDIELADDELRRAEYEDNLLHISNSVLDNCLSTLKHETMYYPSRIRQLVDDDDRNIDAIEEIVKYYKEIYTILSSQAMRQTETFKFRCTNIIVKEFADTDSDVEVFGDKDLMHYLFDIISKQCNNKQKISVYSIDHNYVVFKILMPNLQLTDEQCAALFTPDIKNVPYLLCKQIVRDHSEYTNYRGCGILAERSEKGGTIIVITLPKYKIQS